MALEQAVITTAWAILEEDGQLSNQPVLPQIYAVNKWTDLTGQAVENIPPKPNQYDILIQCDTATMDAIEADTRFEILVGTRKIVGDPDPISSNLVPSQAEFDAFKTTLGQNVDDFGDPAWTQEELDTACGTVPDNRSWRAINEQKNTYEKNRGARTEYKLDLGAELQDPPPEGVVGYKRTGNGTLSPLTLEGNRIQQLFTDGLNLQFNLRDPISDPPAFTRIKVVDGPTAFKFKDGEVFAGGTGIRWPTTWEFTPGESYRIRVVE